MEKILVLGIGNIIRGDDGIGIYCARELRRILPQWFDIKELSTAGLDLLSVIVGYSKVIIIDAIQTKEGVQGAVYRLSLEEFAYSQHISSTHTINFNQLIELGEQVIGETMPKMEVLAIEAKKLHEFSQYLSEELQCQFDQIIQRVKTEIETIITTQMTDKR